MLQYISWLAELLRLEILHEGYIYPKEDRPIRDATIHPL